jgi:N,N'-diacetyllegionaminate synthase
MRLFGKDLSQDIAIIAEIGVNHEGDVDAASRLVSMAAEAGADAVKFQSFSPDRYASATDPARLKRVTGFALDEAAHRRLAAEAEKLGLSFFSTPVTEDVVPLLNELCSALKIASGDLTFEPVIRAAAATGKPVVLSTGIGTIAEIDTAVGWVQDEIGDANIADRLVLMHCISAYPTPVEQANVRSVPFLANRYGVTAGYSNHVIGPEACLAAVALGARVLEVHFTDQKTGREFRDHALSMEPSDVAALKAAVQVVDKSLGRYGKTPAPCEIDARLVFRKGVVAARDLTGSSQLSRDDLMFARPATEFPADQVETIVGKTLIRAVKRGETVARDNVA